MNQPADPNSAAPAESTSSKKASQAPEPPEEKTQPFRLRDLAPKLAQKRRRSTAAELTFRRAKTATELRVPLERSATVIGRDSSCDIVLAEASVSRRHCRIVRNAGGYFELEDLESENGVIVDGDRVSRMTLLDGDTFTVGDTRFAILIAPLLGEE